MVFFSLVLALRYIFCILDGCCLLLTLLADSMKLGYIFEGT